MNLRLIIEGFHLRFLTVLLIFLAAPALAKYSGGSGEPNDPYQIADVNDLLTLANDINDYNKCFIQTSDIDLDPCLPGNKTYTTAVIAPDINQSSEDFQGTAFTGCFDGNVKKIINLRIDTAGAGNDCLGLFGQINGSAAQVKNLVVENVIIAGGADSNNLGALCGENRSGTIRNCFATSSVFGNSNLGGVCGWNSGIISNCCTNSSVSGIDALGCLCGWNSGTISKCYADGSVAGYRWLGGLCGGSSGTISKCYTNAQITGVTNSYYIGGLCGRSHSGTISNCYSTGSVTGYQYTGGFCGSNSGSIAGCFWDVNTSGMDTSAGGTGLTTVQMQMQSTFTDAGWDFINIWHICESTNYPKLIWQILTSDFVCPDGVNFTDFSFFAQRWLDTNCSSNNDCDGTDFDLSGTVDWYDLDAFVENWLLGL